MKYEKVLGRRLKILREHYGLIQAEVAEKAGISLSTYNNIETGYANSTKVSTLIALTNIYGATMDFLVGRVDDVILADGMRILDMKIDEDFE